VYTNTDKSYQGYVTDVPLPVQYVILFSNLMHNFVHQVGK